MGLRMRASPHVPQRDVHGPPVPDHAFYARRGRLLDLGHDAYDVDVFEGGARHGFQVRRGPGPVLKLGRSVHAVRELATGVSP